MAALRRWRRPVPDGTPGSERHDQHDVYAPQCPCREVLDLLADKWSAPAIGAMGDGPQRFGALLRRLEGVSPMVLTSTLRRLEEKGFVDRTVYPAAPPHVEHELTALGHSVAEPLAQLRNWVENHLDEIQDSPPAFRAGWRPGGAVPPNPSGRSTPRGRGRRRRRSSRSPRAR
ncbi:winged helix-turn-helix transcriptional regulator [Streptomyces nojiriensis]|uniref:winged helix-turn-helix transcriptional regulator n=1 Tax=Streptomyces nojiriensis TaxID=66374 RepID=UPI0036DC59B6